MTRPNKILVAFDGSPHSKQALEWAIDLSRNSKGSVVVVYVFEPINIMSIYDAKGGSDMTMKEAVKELKERGQETLEEAKTICVRRGAEVKTELLQGNIAETIIQYAKKEQIDLIIAGTKGRGEVEGLLMGSVTRSLVSLAHIPVLVVKD
jgi:nucleotide-binding universal stress UspA family protein